MNILSYIENKHEKNVSIYIAIGSAAHCCKYDESLDEWNIDPKFEQQFPKFLRDLKEKFPFDPLHIILIDPMLETPPFIVCNSKKKINESWNKNKLQLPKINLETDLQEEYFNKITNIHIYPINKAIGCPGDENIDMYVNFTDFFDTLNILSKLNNWFTVIQDYSGRYMYKFSEYYDNSLYGHRNHIIYGLNARLDESCCVDLLRPACTFIYQQTQNGITVFNPYNFDNIIDMYDILVMLKSNSQTQNEYEIAKDQINIFMKHKKESTIIKLCDIIRQTMLFRNNVSYDKENILSQHNTYISHICNINIIKMLEQKQYNELLDMLYIILHYELCQFISYQYKNNEKEKIKIIDDIIAKIKIEDPFKINNNIRKLINDYYESINLHI